MELAKRMSHFEPAIFSVLNQKKRDLIDAGADVIDLSVGTPPFKPFDHVMQALVEACKDPENYKYALADKPFLTEAVQNWYQRRYHVSLDGDQISSVHGSQDGIAYIAYPFCDVGDTVLAPNPGYQIFSYGPLIAGAELFPYPLLKENKFLPDLDAIDPEVAKKAKLMIVCYPANPVAAIADRAFYEKLIAFAKKYQILIVHDNAYSELIFEGEPGISILSIPGAMDVAVEFNSLSKTYNLSGCRVAFLVGNKEMIGAYKKIRSQVDYGIFLPLQYAAAAALNGPQDQVAVNRAEYKARSRALSRGLTAIGWDCPDSAGSMFVWAPLPKGYENSMDFCLELMDRAKVIAVPGSSFGSLGEGYIRLALTVTQERIAEALERIKKSGIL